MAKKSKKFKITKKTALVSGIVLVVIIGGLVYWHYHSNFNKAVVSPLRTSAQSSTSKNTYSAAPAADNNSNNSRKGNSPTTANQTLDQSPTASFSVVITRASLDTNSQNLQVASLVNGTTSGTCLLSLSQAGQTTITQQNSVEQQNDSYICPIFNTPLSSLPNKGNWNVSVAVTSNGQTVTNNWSGNPVALSGQN
jgi:hypothetical protein